MVEDYAKWKIDLFCVFSKVPEFLLVAFKLLEIHWAAFFFAVLCFIFEKKCLQKTQVFAAACFLFLLLNEKQKKPFVCLNNESSKALHTSQTSWVFCIRFFSRKQSVKQQKNTAQCISSNLKATSKNSGTFENTQKKVDFPLSAVFDQALQLLMSKTAEASCTRIRKSYRCKTTLHAASLLNCV